MIVFIRFCDLLAYYIGLGTAGTDADGRNGGVLNVEDEAIDLQCQCDLESDTDADPFPVYGRVVMTWPAGASYQGGERSRGTLT